MPVSSRPDCQPIGRLQFTVGENQLEARLDRLAKSNSEFAANSCPIGNGFG